jgi:hypothetical protein
MMEVGVVGVEEAASGYLVKLESTVGVTDSFITVSPEICSAVDKPVQSKASRLIAQDGLFFLCQDCYRMLVVLIPCIPYISEAPWK